MAMRKRAQFGTVFSGPRWVKVSVSALAVGAIAASAAACSGIASRPDPRGSGAQALSAAAKAGLFAELNRFTTKLPVIPEGVGPARFDWVRSYLVKPGLAIAETARSGVSVLEAKATGLKASVSLPGLANGARVITDRRTGLGLTIALVGATANRYQQASGVVGWPGGYRGKYDVFATISDGGFEDYVVFSDAPAENRISLDVALSNQVKGLRLVSNTLEFLSRDGDLGLRLAAPRIVDANGKAREVRLSVAGCAYDTDPRLPPGRSLTAPGGRTCTVRLTWDDSKLAYPLLLDPTWSTGSDMPYPAYGVSCGAVYSPNHDDVVVCAGGEDNTNTVRSNAFISNNDPTPTDNVWYMTGSMSTPRAFFGHDEDHKYEAYKSSFWVFDGLSQLNGTLYATNVSESYDVDTGLWHIVGNNTGPGRIDPAVAEDDWTYGYGYFLISGGWNANGYLASSDVIPSFQSGQYVGPSFPDGGRAYHTATQCNGTILIAGGQNGQTVLGTTYEWKNGYSGYASFQPLPYPVENHTANTIQEIGGPLDGYYVYLANGYYQGALGQGWISGIQRSNCTGPWQAWTAGTGVAGEARVSMFVSLRPSYDIGFLTAGGDRTLNVILNGAGVNDVSTGGTLQSSTLLHGRAWAGGTADIQHTFAVVVGGYDGSSALMTTEVYNQ